MTFAPLQNDTFLRARLGQADDADLITCDAGKVDGAACPNRTDDLPLTRRLLYRLS